MHKTAAWPLALLYAGLVVYASLYPFGEWRDQGIEPMSFLFAPTARYWSGFDVGVNVVGYAPLGAMVAFGIMRSPSARHPFLLSFAAGMLLSLAMESLQSYLPARVPSREDFLLNSFGAGLGAAAAQVLEKTGVTGRWNEIRQRWFVRRSRGGLVLLATWPLALLFPAAVPFGLGQILPRLEAVLDDALQDSALLAWLPTDALEGQPLAPGTELFCVCLGLLIPCLLAFCIVRARMRRAVVVLLILAAGFSVTSLSAALSWGPAHVWAWLDLPAQLGMLAALAMALLMVLAPWRLCAALLMLALGMYLILLNQTPESPYFAQTLQDWEQGRFIRFNGLAQWYGWLWPYACLGYIASEIWRPGAKN
jgi:VanZ family protein